MEGPKMARHLPRRLKGGLGLAAAVAAFGLVAATAAMTVGAWTFSLTTSTYTGSTQTAVANAGQSIHDTALVTETAGHPYYVEQGTVTFDLYSNSSCTGTAVYSDVVDYTAAEVDKSSTTASFTSGSYSLPTSITAQTNYAWNVTYVDSVESKTATNSCNEGVTVYAQNQGSVATIPTPNSGDPGTALSDSAQVTGIVDPAGTDTVSFALYLEDPSDPGSCADGTLINDFGASPLVGGTSGPWTATSSGSFAPTAAGTYLWQVQFNAVSDPNNLSSQ
ncbi:MAG: hypothetical protein WBA31_10500, partial [Candidatus Dormiibacterota bacterium]